MLAFLFGNLVCLILILGLLFINQKLISNFNDKMSGNASLVIKRYNLAKFGVWLHEMSHALAGKIFGLNVKKVKVHLDQKVLSNGSFEYTFGSTEFTNLQDYKSKRKHDLSYFFVGLAPLIALYLVFGIGFSLITLDINSFWNFTFKPTFGVNEILAIIKNCLCFPLSIIQDLKYNSLWRIFIGIFFMLSCTLALELSNNDINLFLKKGWNVLKTHHKILLVITFVALMLAGHLRSTLLSLTLSMTIFLICLNLVAYVINLANKKCY